MLRALCGRRTLGCLVIGLLVAVPCQAIDYSTLFDGRRSGAWYLNAKKGFRELLEKGLYAGVERIHRIPASPPQEIFPEWKELFTEVSGWCGKGFFQPAGPVWLTVDDANGLTLLLEGNIDLNRARESASKSSSWTTTEMNPEFGFGLELPRRDGFTTVKIATEKDALTVFSLPNSRDNAREEFAFVTSLAKKPDTRFACEVSGLFLQKRYLSNSPAYTDARACAANMKTILEAVVRYGLGSPEKMKALDLSALSGAHLTEVPNCPAGGTYSSTGDLDGIGEVACSIHRTVKELKTASGTDAMAHPDLREFKRYRAMVTPDKSLFMAAISHPETRGRRKGRLEKAILAMKESGSTTKEFRTSLDALEIFEKGEWIGVSGKGPLPLDDAALFIHAELFFEALCVPADAQQ